MREVTEQVEIKDDQDIVTLKGSYVFKSPKRVERASLQMEAMKAAKQIESQEMDLYFAFSEKVLNEFLVSIDVEHVKSGQRIQSREDLEYYETEALIGQICRSVASGQRLGN